MPRHEHTSNLPRCGMRSQRVSQFYLHAPHSSANNQPYLLLPSQPKLVLSYRPQRDERLSWPGWLVTYRKKCLTPGIEPGQWTQSIHLSTNRANCRLTSLLEVNTPSLHQTTTTTTMSSSIFITEGNKKLCYREEHSASVML